MQHLEEVELLDNHDPAVEFESDSESEAYDFLEKESGLLHIHKFDCCGFYDGLKAGYQSAADRLDTIPTAEKECDKGHWIDITFDASMCSVCQTTQEYETKYCPECGAKMDGDNNVK